MRYGALIIENRFDVSQIIEEHKKFLPESWPIMHFEDHVIKTERDYNALLTSPDFWHSLPFDKVLIFQHDSGLLRKGIEDYLKYDFIGAPLYHIDFPCMNGGLSLRSVPAMIEACMQLPWNPSLGNEDIYFCNLLKRLPGITLPSKEVAQSFSVETIFGLGSVGFHAIEKWHSEEDVKKIKSQYE